MKYWGCKSYRTEPKLTTYCYALRGNHWDVTKRPLECWNVLTTTQRRDRINLFHQIKESTSIRYIYRWTIFLPIKKKTIFWHSKQYEILWKKEKEMFKKKNSCMKLYFFTKCKSYESSLDGGRRMYLWGRTLGA